MIFTAGCTPPGSVSISLPDPDYWPTDGWQNDTSESQGMDSELLGKMMEAIRANQTNVYSVLVIRNGYLVTEAYFHPYSRDTKVHIQSVTKSIIGLLVGKAIGDGYIQDKHQKLLDYYPNLRIANRVPQKDTIQLNHLLSMYSGLDCQEFTSSEPVMEQSADWEQFILDLPMVDAPGKRFGYCNGNAHLLSAILGKSTGMSAREYANRELFQPLGIPPVSEADWGVDPLGNTIGGYGLHLRPVDLAKTRLFGSPQRQMGR